MKWDITKTSFNGVIQFEFDDKKKNDLDVLAANAYVEGLINKDKEEIDKHNAEEDSIQLPYSNFAMQPKG